ncbi:MAG: hypothetical protein FD123_3605 [Bacteroidetes bacterium]|nr:MAG: hypothetical protein FD123_3605 [Bacteroidota bacterium]
MSNDKWKQLEVPLNRSEKLEELLSYHGWRHQVDIGGKAFTPGTRTAADWNFCRMPAKLDGLSFLDVGANDGLNSFEAWKRGARRVVASDIYAEKNEDWHNMTAGWPVWPVKTVKAYLNAPVEIWSRSIMEIDAPQEKFDYVYCGNVLSWLTDPATAIRKLAAVSIKTLHIRDDISAIDGPPLLQYIGDKTGKPTCQFNPNKAFFEKILREEGFSAIEFHEVDEIELMNHRIRHFPKIIVPAGTSLFRSPWTENPYEKTAGAVPERVAFVSNGRGFVYGLGWIPCNELQLVDEQPMIIDTGAKAAIKKTVKKAIGWDKRKPKPVANKNHVIIASR